jgi:dTDP-4-amino-4,6-dideoxygalactose transaminase
MSELAILGGQPVRTQPFPAHNTIGREEKEAVMAVMDTGILSKYLGAWHADFYGGPKVREFEAAWAKYHSAKHAITVNSNTSGLLAAVGAAGIGPGDEVIVTPYTMSATATVIVAYNGVPVFADIRDDIFALDAASIQRCITPRTKAIMIVHIFGHPADMDPVMAIAREHNLIVIEDCAQVPGARYKGRPVGTLGHLGVFSLNYHKHIHTGEGGVVTTNDDGLAERVQLIRNHGESVVGDQGVEDLSNTFGLNLRMNEIEAAIGLEQLKKLPALLAHRIRNAEYLAEKLGKIPGLTPPTVLKDCMHVYYTMPFRFDRTPWGISRNLFVKAVLAELPSSEERGPDLPLMGAGYVTPLYLLPMFQKQIAHGPAGFPFKGPHYQGAANYRRGICPVAERMHFEELFTLEFMRPPATLADMDDVVRAFEKVYEHRAELARHADELA